MPYKFVREHWHLPEQYNRRKKLTDADRERIRTLFAQGMSIGGIGRAFGVNKRMIQFIIYPDRYERNKQLRAERGGSKIYYNREKNRIDQRNTQRYKQHIYLRTNGGKNE